MYQTSFKTRIFKLCKFSEAYLKQCFYADILNTLSNKLLSSQVEGKA